MRESRQLCTFLVDDLHLGVDVTDVQEVIRFQQMTAVPLAPEVVLGLINLRGQIVTVLDLRAMLGLPPLQSEELPTNVVIRGGQDEAVSVLVDSLSDVVDTDDADFEPVPPTLSGPARDLVLGAYKLPDRLLLVLDTDRVRSVDRATAGALA
jgi:purine-binding chemotaxis protein CheW